MRECNPQPPNMRVRLLSTRRLVAVMPKVLIREFSEFVPLDIADLAD